MLSRETQEQDLESFQDKYILWIPYIHHVVFIRPKICLQDFVWFWAEIHFLSL